MDQINIIFRVRITKPCLKKVNFLFCLGLKHSLDQNKNIRMPILSFGSHSLLFCSLQQCMKILKNYLKNMFLGKHVIKFLIQTI